MLKNGQKPLKPFCDNWEHYRDNPDPLTLKPQESYESDEQYREYASDELEYSSSNQDDTPLLTDHCVRREDLRKPKQSHTPQRLQPAPANISKPIKKSKQLDPESEDEELDVQSYASDRSRWTKHEN